jgi:hypothetical protein
MLESGYVFIKSVASPSAQGRNRQVTSDGRTISDRTKAARAATWFTPSVSVSKNQLNTGFWKTIVNPYKSEKKESVKLPAAWETSDIWKQDQITIQQWLEIKYDHPAGFYSSEKPDIFDRRGKTATYLQGFRYELSDGITVLDLSKERDHIMYLLALQSDKIASSIKDVNPAVHSHYIAEVNEDERGKNIRVNKLTKAFSYLHKLSSDHPESIYKKFAVLTDITKTSTLPAETYKSKLYDYLVEKINSDSNADKFINVYETYHGSKDQKARLDTVFFLKEMTNNYVISMDKGKYTWVNAPNLDVKDLGVSEAKVVDWLMLPTSADWRTALAEEYKTKTGLIIQ